MNDIVKSSTVSPLYFSLRVLSISGTTMWLRDVREAMLQPFFTIGHGHCVERHVSDSTTHSCLHVPFFFYLHKLKND